MAQGEQEILGRILQAIKTVDIPGLKSDLVSLNFIKNLKFLDGDASFDVELSTPVPPPLQTRIRDLCLGAVSKVDGVKGVFVEVKTRAAQAAPRVLEGVKNTIAVASGKGGVGKSTTAVNLALALRGAGARVGLMDADIYGPSIPMMMGVDAQPQQTREGKLLPPVGDGVKLMSAGFLNQTGEAMIWRGPIVSNLVQQFLGVVDWGELDYLVIDLPPGTGDIQLTLTQHAPLTGAVVVTTPQEVALLDARKGLKMFQKVNVPVLGIVENMSYYLCSDCGKRADIFGSGGGQRVADEFGVPLLGQIPIDPAVVAGGDSGKPVFKHQPDSPVAKAIREFADNTVTQIQRLSSTEESFDSSFSMQWK